MLEKVFKLKAFIISVINKAASGEQKLSND